MFLLEILQYDNQNYKAHEIIKTLLFHLYVQNPLKNKENVFYFMNILKVQNLLKEK